MSEKPPTLKPIVLYDHLPGILAGYPAVLFLALALLSLVPGRSIVGSIDEPAFEAIKTHIDDKVKSLTEAGDTAAVAAYEESKALMSAKTPFFDPHMLFWIGLTVMLVWYIAFRFNLPKGKFFLMFFMIGTLVGIPVVLELQGTIRPFKWMGEFLGGLEPTMDTGGWLMMSLVFSCIWLGNFIYSRTHMRVRIDESGLTVNRLGGKRRTIRTDRIKNRKRTSRLSGNVSGRCRFPLAENENEQTNFYHETCRGPLSHAVVSILQREAGSD